MKKHIRYVGLDVHANMIAVAVAESGRDGEVRFLGYCQNSTAGITKLLKKLGELKNLRFCYEAGPCGYGLYWRLLALGAQCAVVAPSLIPKKSGDRVKTDRRDAEKLARCHRAGELTEVWVPDRSHEAFRTLVRTRENAKQDQTRHRNQLDKFLRSRDRSKPRGMTSWKFRHRQWLRAQKFEQLDDQIVFNDLLHEIEHCEQRLEHLEKAIDEAIERIPEVQRELIKALQALRGVAKITSVTVVAEVGSFSRFEHPKQLMGYSGLVPREYSSGGPGCRKQGGITKTGNTHLRRVACESAWHSRSLPLLSRDLKKRQQGLDPQIIATAWKAQHRLNGRYRRLLGRSKDKSVVAAAIARELLGFMWAIGRQTEQLIASRQ